MAAGSQDLHISVENKSVVDGKCKNEGKESCFVIRFRGGIDTRSSQESLRETQAETPFDPERIPKRFKPFAKILRYIQNAVLTICWLTFTYFLMTKNEFEYEKISLSVPAGKEGLTYNILNGKPDLSLCLRLYGSFLKNTFKFDELIMGEFDKPNLAVNLLLVGTDGCVKTSESVLRLYLAENQKRDKPKIEMVEKIIKSLHIIESQYQLQFYSNINETIPLQLAYEFTMMSQQTGLILGLILLVLIYIALVFETVHRTLAGIICSTLSVGIIAAVHLRPTQHTIFNEWGNIDTIMLFFGVSIIIDLLLETGLQDHLAAVIYELAHGHIWPMLHYLLLATCLLSNILDEVLLVLFIAPICLRLCEVMQLNCTPVLSALIIAINLGSTLTPISSMVNNLIINSTFLPKEQIGLGEFMAHMLPATLLTLAQSYIHLRLQYHNSDKMRMYEPLQVIRLKRLIRVWRKTSASMGDYTWDESLARKTVDRRIVSLRKRLRRLGRMPEKPKGFEERVRNLRKNFPIRKHFLLIVCLVTLFITFLFSILARVPGWLKISKGWIAMLTAMFALSLTAYEDIEGLLSRIDWGTMLFFVTLSILMQVLISLGLLESIGLMLEHFVIMLDERNRLTVAILLIIWISAILTTFIDNVPVADMMMRIIGTLSLNQNINIPIMPLVWSLALGCSLGGNGSIVGAVANIACAGVASRHGYRLTFFGYFKIGFFVMLGNVLVASCYLLLVHVGFQWH